MLRRKERWLVGVCTVVLCVMFLTVRDGYGVRRGGGVAAAEAAARHAVDHHYGSPRIVSISFSRRFSALN